MSLNELSHRSGVAVATIRQYERSYVLPSEKLMRKLLPVVHLNPDYYLGKTTSHPFASKELVKIYFLENEGWYIDYGLLWHIAEYTPFFEIYIFKHPLLLDNERCVAMVVRDKKRNIMLFRREDRPLEFREGLEIANSMKEIAHEKGNTTSVHTEYLSYSLYEKLLDWTVERKDILTELRHKPQPLKAVEQIPMATRP